MTMIENLQQQVEEWKQIACDKNKRINALEDDNDRLHRSNKAAAAELERLRNELEMSGKAFELQMRENLQLQAENEQLKAGQA